MRRIIWIVAVSAFVLMAGTAPALADEFRANADHCLDRNVNPDLRIGACTWLLNSGRLFDNYIPPTFVRRGMAYADKGLYDQAIRDYDQAIRLKPDYAVAFGNRGSAYAEIGRMGEATRDWKRQYDLGSHPQWLIEELRRHGILK